MPRQSPLAELAKAHNVDKMSSEGNLENDIHPLFYPQKFPDGFEYDEFVPSFRLATRLLDTPQMRLYFGKIFFGQLHKVEDFDYPTGIEVNMYSIRSDKRIHTMTNEDVAAVQGRLLLLSGTVEYDFGVEDEFARGTSMYCDAQPKYFQFPDNGPGVIANQTFGPPHRDTGCYTKISIVPGYYDQMLKIWKSKKSSNLKILETRFDVAVTFLHEVAHAAQFGRARAQFFFEDSPVMEAGFESEIQQFGGLTDCEPRGILAHFGTTIDLTEWPYNNDSSCFGTKTYPCRMRDTLSKRRKTWAMPKSFVESIFSEWFWEEMGTGKLDARALIPDPIVRSMEKALREGERIPVPPSVIDLFEHYAEIDHTIPPWHERFSEYFVNVETNDEEEKAEQDAKKDTKMDTKTDGSADTKPENKTLGQKLTKRLRRLRTMPITMLTKTLKKVQ